LPKRLEVDAATSPSRRPLCISGGQRSEKLKKVGKKKLKKYEYKF
jgi:hypothetical protein